MPVRFGSVNGVYDNTHTWQNANDRVSAERAFSQSPAELAKISQAVATADPATPEMLIQESMAALPALPVSPTEPLTVMECFGPDLGNLAVTKPTEFSGGRGEFQGTSIPSMSPW